MRNKILVVLALAALIGIAGLAEAQAQNGRVAAWYELMPKFVDATNGAMTAEARLSSALGLAAQAESVTTAAKNLNAGSSPGTVEQVMATRSAVAQAIAAKLATPGLALDGAAKAQFSDGIDGLARSFKQYEDMSGDLPLLKQVMRNAGDKGRTGLFVAKSMADYKRDAKQELAAAVVFARANSVPYAAEVDAMVAP